MLKITLLLREYPQKLLVKVSEKMKDFPLADLYKKMFLVRSFENRLLELFSQGKLNGTTHTYSGQEAVAASVISNMNDDDVVFSNHRGHGHYLIKENDPRGLLAEIMGKEEGVCGGRGGSQHLHRNNFYSNGIQGGTVANALGMAFAEKYKKTGNMVTVFIGDGTIGEGIVYESFNLASLWSVPLLVVIENNRYAQTTSVNDNLSGSFIKRAQAFGIKCGEIESNNIYDLFPLFGEIINEIRLNQSPYIQIVHTYRQNAHSKGDDYRDKKEIAEWMERDPLIYAEREMDNDEILKIRNQVEDLLNQVLNEVESMSHHPGL